MADALFFVIPRASLITLPKYFSLNTNNDARVAYAEVKAWTYQQQDRGLVVIIDLESGDESATLQYRSIVAFDGPWVDQLLAVSTDPTIGSKTFKIAAGGVTGVYDPPVSGPTLVTPGQYELFTGPYTPYVTESNQNISFATPGYLTVDWQTGNPADPVWFQAYATINIKAGNANQRYGVAFMLNGVVNANSIVIVDRDSTSDTEQIMLHGHRPVPNGTQIGIGITNLDNTNTPDVVGVNLRVFGGYYGT